MNYLKALFGTLFISLPILVQANINQIQISISAQDEKVLFDPLRKAEKYTLQSPVQVQVNQNPEPYTASLKTRGQSCLYAKRKCYSLSFEKLPLSDKKPKVAFNGATQLKGNSFNLASMWQDLGYLSTQIGFEFFRSLQIFDMRTEYTLVQMNNKPQGLYLITDKPKNAIERVSENAFVGRRGYGARLEVTDAPKTSTVTDKKAFEAAFKEIYEDIKKYQGEILKFRLEQRMDLKQYMQWLVVNSILENGDYSDEVYFYAENKKPIYFKIMPWDFDDLFAKPHSSKANNETYKDRFEAQILYSYENPLDVVIGSDPVLYSMLEQVALDLLVKVQNRFVDETLQKVYLGLRPYLDHSEALDGGLLDRRKKAYTVSQIESVLEKRNQQIKTRIQKLIKMITQNHPTSVVN